MFRKAIIDTNMQAFSTISRTLHTLFIDRPDPTLDNAWMKNLTDHDHPPPPEAGAGRGSSSSSSSSNNNFTKEEVSSTTKDDAFDDMNNQTLHFTLIFLGLMIVYLAFCLHYRKLKFRRSYNDDGTTSSLQNNRTRRWRRQRDNQAVLDESNSAANRAAADEEEQRKLEERKRRIEEVLWTRLIVEEEEERVEKGDSSLTMDDGDEENQVNEKSCQERNDFEDVEMGSKKTTAVMMVEGRTLAQDEDASAAAASLATSSGETAISTVPSSNEGTIISIPSNEEDVPTNVTSPSLTDDAPSSSSSTSPSSPFRRYADALSCNNCHHHATNYCSNHHITSCNSAAQTNNDANIATNSPSGNNKSSSTSNNNNNNNNNNSPSSSLSQTTITLSEIQQTYGDECNICLSTFQVGDRAAWSKHHFNGCVHVFHDECMKRWLLVRDGCPICRRLYLDEKGTMKQSNSVVPTPQDDGGGGGNGLNGHEGESERDLESGGGANGIITIEEE